MTEKEFLEKLAKQLKEEAMDLVHDDDDFDYGDEDQNDIMYMIDHSVTDESTGKPDIEKIKKTLLKAGTKPINNNEELPF